MIIATLLLKSKQQNFFSQKLALTLLFPYDALTSCKKAKKSLESFLRKVCTNY